MKVYLNNWGILTKNWEYVVAEAYLVLADIRFKENEYICNFVDDTDIKKAEEVKERLKEKLINDGWKPDEVHIKILPLDNNQSAMFRGFKK